METNTSRNGQDRRRGLALGLALSAVAGYVDALGVLALGGLFVAFMSGNTTRLGIGLVQDDAAALVVGAAAIAGFVGGVFLGTLLREAAGARLRIPAILATEAGLLALAAALHGGVPPAAEGAVLALAMGVQNLARQAFGGAQAGATFVTGTLVGLGQSLAEALTGRAGSSPAVHAGAWIALLAGSSAAALAFARLGFVVSLGLAPALLLGLAVAATAWRDRG